MRRRKEDVAKELPPKTEIVRSVALGEAQAALYEGIRLSMEKRVRDAIDMGAEVLAVACPFCLIMLEEAAMGRGDGDAPVIEEIAEVIAGALQAGAQGGAAGSD